MTEEQEQELSYRICETLRGLCPAFTEKRQGAALWHRGNCLTDGSCECVWHRTDTCEAGKWPQLSYIADVERDASKAKEAMMAKVKLVMSGA